MVLFGYNRIGYDLLKSLRSISKSYMVVDYNPDIVASLKKKGIPVIYGDASDVDFLASIEFSKSKFIVSTIPEVATNVVLLDYIKSNSKKKPIFMAIAHKIDEATELYKAGADYVIMPHFLGARHVASLIEKYGADSSKFKEEKARHLRELQERRALGHEHPTLDFKI
jgi:voltage-gated potassium channel Kch